MPIITQSSQNNEVNWNDPLNKGLVYWLKPKNLQVFSGTDGDPNADLVGIDGGVVSPSAGVSLATSEIGQVWDKQGGNYVRIRSSLPSLNGEQMTWGGWYKTTTTGETWWSNNYDAAGPSSEQIIRTSNQAAGVFFRPTGWLEAPSNSTPINTWNHIIGVINVTDGYVACYVNGILSASVATGSTPITTGTQDWVIGGRASDPSESNRSGQFGDQRWYNRALSDSEVHDLYVASRTGYQDQFKRRYFPVSTTIEEPPTEETTGGLIRLKSASQNNEVNWNDPLNEGLVAWYPMRQKGGNVLRDVTDYGNNGNFEVISPASSWSINSEAKSQSFQFGDDSPPTRIDVPNSDSINSACGVGQARTISFWAKTTLTTNRVIFEKGTNLHFVVQTTSSRIAFRTNETSLGNCRSDIIADGKWHFLCFTHLAGTNYAYTDGNFSEFEHETAPSANSHELQIGARDGSFPYVGGLSDVRIYNRALSESEVHDLYVASRTGYQDQFKRRYFPVSTTVEEPPVQDETSGGLIRLRSPTQSQPSYAAGYAKSASESANPELWEGLVGAWMPSLGSVGGVLHDATGQRKDGASSRSAFNGSAAGVKDEGIQAVTYDYSGSGSSDASNDYFVVESGLNPKNLTISAVVNLRTSVNEPSTSARWSIAGEYDNSTNRRQWQLAPFSASDNIIKLALSSLGTNFGVYAFETDMAADSWYHIVATYDGSSVRGWVNGAEESISLESGSSITGDLYSSDVDMRIGSIVKQSNDNGVWRGDIGDLCVWDRALTPSEVQEVFSDPLAPFRQRKSVPYTLTSTPPVQDETTGGLIRLRSPKQTQPSYKTGYAKSASESANPELWYGLVGAWVPGIGNTGYTLFDLSGNGHNSTPWTNPYWSPRGVAYGTNTSDGYEVDLSWFDPSRFCQVSAFWYNGTPCESRTNCGMGHWASGETELITRFDAANASNIRHLLTLSGSNFDNTLTDDAKLGRNLVAFQYDESQHIGQQYVNGSLTETSGGSGTVSAWTTHELWGHSSLSQLAMLDEDFSGNAILLYDRWLTRQELDALNADPLAPFRQRKSVPYTLTSTPPVQDETTGGLIRLKSPRQTQPSYKAGYAKSASESAYPELWDGLRESVAFGLGITGNIFGQASDIPFHEIGTGSAEGFVPTLAGFEAATLKGQPSYRFDKDQAGAVYCSDNGRLDFEDETFTVAAWVHVESSGSTQTILMKAAAFDYDAVNYFIGVTGSEFSFGVSASDGGTSEKRISGGTVELNTWHFVAGVHRSGGEMGLFVDGVPVATGTAVAATASNSGDLVLGGFLKDNTALGFEGCIHSVYIYGRELTAKDQRLLIADPLAPFRQRRTAIYSTQATTPPETTFLPFWASNRTTYIYQGFYL